MGMDLIGVGYTVDTSVSASVEEAQKIVDLYRLAIEVAWDEIDENGSYEQDEVFDAARAGAEIFAERDQARMSVGYPVPGHEHRYFYFAGGGSWGDQPFDGFDELCTFLAACEAVPGLGQALGVLGVGIRN